eukprot:Pompholyxophrys_punicea_v1_NODE_1235_length_845_cov_8.888608.p1 type:complete len:115 gc:universal NODE_1235_length_845_cov_8.888608:671-327(-)
MLGFLQIPQHSHTVFASGSAQRTIGRNSYCIHISIVPNVVCAKFAISQIPDLDKTIPAPRNNDWIVGRKSNARNPIRVTVFCNCVFAFTQCIPKLNGLIARSRNNLTIISRERN